MATNNSLSAIITNSLPSNLGISNANFSPDNQHFLLNFNDGSALKIPVRKFANDLANVSPSTIQAASLGLATYTYEAALTPIYHEFTYGLGSEIVGYSISAAAAVTIVLLVVIAYIEWQKQIEQLNEANQARKKQRDNDIKQLQSNRKLLANNLQSTLNADSKMKTLWNLQQINQDKLLAFNPSYGGDNLLMKMLFSNPKLLNTPSIQQGNKIPDTINYKRNFKTPKELKERFKNDDPIFSDWQKKDKTQVNSDKTLRFIHIVNGKVVSDVIVIEGDPTQPIHTIIKRDKGNNPDGTAINPVYSTNTTEAKTFDVFFDTNSDSYDPQNIAKTNSSFANLIKYLKQNPKATINVNGNSNFQAKQMVNTIINGVPTGSNSIANLVQNRAIKIQNQLIQLGANPSQINITPPN